MKAGVRIGGALLAAALCAPVAAADFDLAALMATLARVAAAKDKFVERKHSALLEAPLVLRGTLVYTRPDRLEKHILSPYQETTVIAGDTVVIENRSLKQTRRMSLSSSGPASALIESIRATLAGDVPALERHFRIALEGTPEAWQVTLLPRDERLAGLIAKVRISGARAQIGRIEIEEVSGDRSVMTIGAGAT